LLALSFLVHTGYVNATTMECYSSGRSEVNLMPKDFCCAVEALDFAAVSPKCCAFEKTEKVFDGFAGKAEFEVEQIALAPLSERHVAFSIPHLREADSYSLKSPPDLLSGISLLKFISVFRL